ncbi:hypothetical protein [uncultured Corynebacterium sp.]|uniref:hypothetical protein n=1 Tax=uncultured Corynebacterium sp. TaxID=159447 RepID=UPI002607EA8B|nr:hypothetical protein [uncultured Corynebacterium sp.]
MRTFNVPLALIPLVAISATALVAPANAASVRIEGETCRYAYNASEMKYFNASGISPRATMDWKEAQSFYASSTSELERDRQGLKNLEEDYKNGLYLDKNKDRKKAEQQYLSEVNAIKADIKAKETLQTVAQKCAAGEDFNDPDAQNFLPDPTNNNQDSKPGTDSALSTEDGELNGAGIGVVVAGVIAVLIAVAAAAFPQLQAMLG